MMSSMVAFILSMLLSSLMMMINLILSKKMIMDREKSSPFECGFDPKSSSRTPLSIKFFLIGMIFLIFDIEIALLLPMIPSMNMTSMYQWSMTSTVFILVLIMGLYHEWNQGALTWTK